MDSGRAASARQGFEAKHQGVGVSYLKPQDVAYLDHDLLDADGRIKLMPAAYYQGIPSEHLMVWGTLKARFSFPTAEMIDWLKNKIAGRKVIEIGSGNGDLGYHLGIPQTDNYCQRLPDVQLYYAVVGQPTTNPRADVEQIDAVQAIEKYKPEVVVGSFITQKSYADSPVIGGGNCYGPEEEEILARVKCYIHIGNDGPHGNKRIKKHPHEVLRFPWLFTKAMAPEKNAIYVWERP